jgi:hypothetical protein
MFLSNFLSRLCVELPVGKAAAGNFFAHRDKSFEKIETSAASRQLRKSNPDVQ